MDFEERYSWTDRLLHRIAFRLGHAQRTLADVEETLYRDAIQATSVDEPVFVTSLPRAGTTILLRLLWRTGRFATHTYRDMPFVLCPMIWRRYADQFKGAEETMRERAHGDGIEISERSPEAFEEMIWKHFWTDHYREDHIRPWRSGDQNPAFDSFFETHIRKVLAVHQNGEPGALRYLSKNNLNIARLAAPPPGLQQGTFVIPFRDPLQQAASMQRQHRRFLEIHEEDDFVREYMEAIGHHEFGEGLKPVNFRNWLDADPPSPSDLEFWLRYWTAAYQFVLEHSEDSTVLVSYARLTEAPEPALEDIASALGVDAGLLTEQADRLHPPRTHDASEGEIPMSVRREAETIHEQLRNRATA